MSDYSQRWREKEGAEWKAMLDEITRTVERLRGGWGGEVEVTRERGGTPNLDIRWYADDIGRAIQILIEGDPAAYLIVITISAWKDIDSPPLPRERKWHSDEVIKIPLTYPPNWKLVHPKIDDSLQNAHAAVSRWDETTLSEKIELLPLAPGLKKIGRGRYVL